MEPVSSTNRTSSLDPTAAELEAAACLPQEPESRSALKHTGLSGPRRFGH